MKINLKYHIDEARLLANERHNQKKGYKSHLKLSYNYELVGILGEMVFSIVTGLDMDKRLLPNGDDGYDFPDINIKSSEEYKAKHLIEFKNKKFNGWYVFVIINLEEKYGYIKGFIHSENFIEQSKVVDFGYGERLSIGLEKLLPYKPKKPIELKYIYKKEG